jgi:methylated-DNA-protein-cysteine methyltransferase-like protein
MKSSKKSKSPVEHLPVVNPSGSREESFFERVYEIVRQVPKGRVTSYGAIAACLGTRMSARLVGWAMNAAHDIEPPVPAHRVVNRNGMLSGKMHFSTPDRMQELLEQEGIIIENDTVKDFKILFWNPVNEQDQ